MQNWSLNVPQVSILWGGFSKYLQNVSLHFQDPLKNTLKNVAYILDHFGYAPPFKTVVIQQSII